MGQGIDQPEAGLGTGWSVAVILSLQSVNPMSAIEKAVVSRRQRSMSNVG